ncbi:LptA/OstA family protein [uncultured Campylobacter sp.]|uniref:LptA/OstA family protein n=1 Tax=uncultured Campylobacter sp. TaxID=218934 RepID=UPI0026162A3E
MACKLIIGLFLSFNILFADKIEVKALNFYADENTGKSVLSGNVVVSRGKDVLNAEELVIFMDKNRKPLRYEASKNPKFSIILNDKTYKGSGDKFIYNVAKDTYEINGNAFIHEINTDKKLYGDKIIVDRKANIYQVQSRQNKPARFVFELKNDK